MIFLLQFGLKGMMENTSLECSFKPILLTSMLEYVGLLGPQNGRASNPKVSYEIWKGLVFVSMTLKARVKTLKGSKRYTKTYEARRKL